MLFVICNRRKIKLLVSCIYLRSEISLVLSDLHSRKIGVPEFDRNVFIARKLRKYDRKSNNYGDN